MSDKLAFQFKMQQKQLDSQASKFDKQEKKEREKVKKALTKGDMAGAQIAAENAIRNHNESLNTRRMAARVDGVQARVATAAAQQEMAKNLKQTNALMSKVAAQMPLTETSQLMDALEKNFEDLEVKSKVMDDAMQRSTGTQQPADQVALLMQQIGNEIGIEVNLDMPTIPKSSVTVSSETAALEKRLNELRGGKATS